MEDALEDIAVGQVHAESQESVVVLLHEAIDGSRDDRRGSRCCCRRRRSQETREATANACQAFELREQVEVDSLERGGERVGEDRRRVGDRRVLRWRNGRGGGGRASKVGERGRAVGAARSGGKGLVEGWEGESCGGERGGLGLDGDAKVVVAGSESVKLLSDLVDLIRRKLRVEDQVLELQRERQLLFRESPQRPAHLLQSADLVLVDGVFGLEDGLILPEL